VLAAAGPLVAAGDVSVERHVGKGAIIQTQGSVRIGGYVDCATVICGGELLALEGVIKGGNVAAHRGVTCKCIGDPQGTPTELLIGFDPPLLDAAEARIPEIQKAFAKVAQYKTLLEPMLKEHQSLTPEQKEHVTDLLYRASEAKKRGVTATQQFLKRFAEANNSAKMECVVSDTIFAGVTLCFPDARVAIATAIKGPVKISASRGTRSTTVHAEFFKTGKSQALPLVAHLDRMASLRATLERLEQS
jgi:uncharacterized protein (DUF342 family)